jgi:hypothetical protein
MNSELHKSTSYPIPIPRTRRIHRLSVVSNMNRKCTSFLPLYKTKDSIQPLYRIVATKPREHLYNVQAHASSHRVYSHDKHDSNQAQVRQTGSPCTHHVHRMYIFSSTIDLRSRRVLSPRHLQSLPEPNEPRSPEDYVLRTPECYGPFHQGPCATELLRRE